jgi:thiamine-phosphate pyrophosphorylase
MSETPARLFLITPPVADAAGFAPLLEAAMGAADVACVLLRTAAQDEASAKAVIRALAPLVQRREAACLIAEDPRRAARVDADGVHIGRLGPALEEAVDALSPRKIVGVGGLANRDDAMAAGESGVDYLMFGGPDEPVDQDTIIERVAWWAEIFNVPCVGYAADPSHAGAVARAGAEFVAVCHGVWDGSPDQVAATLAEVAAAIRSPDLIAS